MNAVIFALILKYSMLYNLDPRLVEAIIKKESSYKVDAIGEVGEVGLMQIRPEYYPRYTPKQLMNPSVNIKLGTKHLKQAMENCVHKKNNTWIVCYNLGLAGAKKLRHPEKWPYYQDVMEIYDDIPEYTY